MGPSGGGKTSLLNILSGRVKNNGGTITYHDQVKTKSLKSRIGFVLQDDVVFPHLTVKETLTYSALLRLPNTLSIERKKERAMSVILELGLERCQNTMIGGTFVRGVSGGERKRVCIGNEILLNPSLLFLDEPTSGLDSTTALRIVQMLRVIAQYLLGAYESRGCNMEKIEIRKTIVMVERQDKRNSEECGANWRAQFSILFERGLKERRHKYLSSLRIIQVASTAIIVGLLWWNSDHASSTNYRAKDQAGILFFISVFWAFFPVFTTILTFPQERAMLAKERSVDMYKLSAYLVARNTTDLPLDLLLPIIFLIIIYFMVGGLKRTFPAFSLTLLSIFLTIIAAQGLGLSIGATFMDVKKATTLASVTVMTFMLSGGFFIKKVPPFMSWIRYISLNYHTYRLLLKIQYNCTGGSPSSGPSSSVICESHFVKTQNQVDYGGTEVGAMLFMIIFYRLITYIMLRRMKLKTE